MEVIIIPLSFVSIKYDFSMEIFRSKSQQIMILRNPFSWRDSLFIVCLFALLVISIPLSSQGVIGVVKEKVTNQPVALAIISVLKGDSLITSLTTDNEGHYTYLSTNAERISMTVQALGYKPQTTDYIFLDGYSTYRQENYLEINPFNLEGVTVTATRPTVPYTQTISPEDIINTAANFDDPVRVAQSRPGIVLLNDQANHLSLRGKSPVFNNWYLEGLEIVNPNHTNNAGTFSDLPTQYGGGVNMFSAQTLGETNIYTGINPLSIGNIGGAAIDMQLHESAKPEWRAKAGLIGFELGGGTAIGSSSILDVNLRYSFTGLLTDLGADFGGEKIGFYDGVISFRNQGLRHKLKLFAWAGSSKNEFNKVENPDDRERYKDFFDIDYGNDIVGAGARYDLNMSPKLFLRSGFAFSTNQSTYDKNGKFEADSVMIDYNDQISITSSFVELSFLHSQRIHATAAIHFENRTYKNDHYSYLPFFEESQIRPSFQIESTISKSLQLELGGEVYHSFTYEKWIPGYRATLNWSISDKNSLFGGIRHAAGEPLQTTNTNDKKTSVNFISDNYELGWKYAGRSQGFDINIYYQQMSHLTAYEYSGAFIYLADFPYSPIDTVITGIEQNGISRHIGIEGSWYFKNKKGWSLDLNQSVYKSERGLKENPLESGRYDNRYATHLSIAKEVIRVKNGKNRIWNFSMRGLLNGGLWEAKINEEKSQLSGTTIFEYPGSYDQQLPAYKRIDFGISRTIATPKIRWRYSLDIQNLFGLSNIAYHYYDPFLQSTQAEEQLGIIPVFSVQASW